MSVSDQQQNLLQAWRKRDLQRFKDSLKESSVDPNFLYADEGYVTLLDAVASDHSEDSNSFAEALLDAGARPDAPNFSGRSPLLEAASHANYNVLATLLARGADVNARDSAGSTALHLLASPPSQKRGFKIENQMACVDLLLAQPGIELNRKNNRGQTAMGIAVQQGAKNFVIKLLGQGSRLDVDSGPKPLRGDITAKFPDLKTELPPVPVPDWMYVKMDGNNLFTLLHAGEEERFCDAFRREMEDKSKHSLLTYTDGQQTFLMYAASHNLHQVLSEVLNQGADPDATPQGGQRPLHLACNQGDSSSAEILLKYGAKIDADDSGVTALHVAARAGHYECFEPLLKHGAKIDAVDKFGRTALHIAARCGHQKCCRTLLELGAYFGTEDTFHEPLVTLLSRRVLEEFLDSKVAFSNRCCDDYRLDFDLRFLNPNRGGSNDPEMVSLSQGTNKYPKSFPPETKPLLNLATSQARNILAHPVLAAFAQCKFNFAAKFFHTELILNILFAIFVTGYSLIGYQRPENEYPFYILLFQFILGAFVGFRFLSSLIPCLARPVDHICRISTWIDLIINALVVIIVAKDCPRVNLPENLNGKCQVFAAISVLLIWIQLTFFISRHPKIAVFRLIFYKFSVRALHILVYFALVFIAFSISLHLLERNCSDCSKIFENVGSSIYHVLIIAAGDVDSNSTPKQSPGIAHLLFLICLFFIVILLSNILVGVVVHETLHVYEEGLVPVVEAQLRIAHQIENVIEDFRYLHRQINILIKCPIRNNWCKRFYEKIYFFAQCESIAVLPHENGRVDFELMKSKLGNAPKIFIHPDIIQRAESILRMREDKKTIAEPKTQHQVLAPISVTRPDVESSKLPENESDESSEQILRYMKTFMTRLDTLEQFGKQSEDLLIKILAVYSVNQANSDNR